MRQACCFCTIYIHYIQISFNNYLGCDVNPSLLNLCLQTFGLKIKINRKLKQIKELLLLCVNVQESKVQKHFLQAERLQIPDYSTALSDTTDWLGVGGDRRGAQNRGIFSFDRAVVPSPYRVGTNARKSLVHQEVNRPFVAVYYSCKDSGHASLSPPPSPPPKWKVELKNTETDQDSKHATTARLHQDEEEKNPASPPFRALRHHFWEVLLRQLTSSFRLPLQMCGFPAQ